MNSISLAFSRLLLKAILNIDAQVYTCSCFVSMVAGLSESEKEAILERHMADVAMQQDAREQERRRQRETLEVSCSNNTANQRVSF